MKIEFHETTHLYRVDGIFVPSVTQVLADLYNWNSVPPKVLARKRALGRAVHKAIELDVQDQLDEASLDREVRGYFKAWRRFRLEKQFQCYLSEHRVASKKYRYAGTLDLVGVMDGAEVLIDTKNTYHVHPQSALQTAAYSAAAMEMGVAPVGIQRYALHLQKEGTYQLRHHKSKQDFPIFLACLSRYNWQLWHGLAKENAR